MIYAAALLKFLDSVSDSSCVLSLFLEIRSIYYVLRVCHYFIDVYFSFILNINWRRKKQQLKSVIRRVFTYLLIYLFVFYRFTVSGMSLEVTSWHWNVHRMHWCFCFYWGRGEWDFIYSTILNPSFETTDQLHSRFESTLTRGISHKHSVHVINP